ncbi:hypothetical protein [Oerskovia flava]|uniref:hypothetical protein n=1 Tax=Oerskovia flava TaxID=2986422 RepID=UPI00223F24C7|nr:hypothetical protein [Oerskovia sp. JB1-3-2]
MTEHIPGEAEEGPGRVDLKLLGTYLVDHVTGATVGLNRVERMADAYEGTFVGDALAPFVGQFEHEREWLVQTTEGLGVHISRYKVVGAFVAERLGRLKPNGRIVSTSPLSALLEVELLRSAILGKLSGWETLESVAPHLDVDASHLPFLQDQAREQIDVLTRVLRGLRPNSLLRPLD